MSCSVTIQSVTATAFGTVSTLHITVVASDCKMLQLIAKCAGGTNSSVYPLTGGASETVTEDLRCLCPCGANVEVTAYCVDPLTYLPIPGCTSDTYQGPIQCGNECCIQPQITYVPGNCNANNERIVTFTTVFNVPATLPSTCFPLIGQLDFGDTNFGGLHIISGPGSFSFTDTHPYNANSASTYQAAFVYANPPPPTCPSVSVSVNVSSCTPPDCCPRITDVTIDPGPCQSDCTRVVTIKTYFSPPLGGCLAETLQWHFFDKNGIAINVSSNAFLTSGVSPNVQGFIFDPALAPITAKLTGLQYPKCVDTVRTIDIELCDVAPACPTIHLFTANVMGCENVGGECLRRVEFTLDADIAAGCGTNAGTKIEIGFDDGDQTQLQFNSSGHYTITASHHYAGGNYQPTLTILNPSQCFGKLIEVQVPACRPEDCNIDAPCPPVPKPPSWCLCKLCYIFSQKLGKGWCKAILILVALWVSLVIVAAFLGWSQFISPAAGQPWTWLLVLKNIGAAVSIIGSAGLVLWYSNKCGNCCLACAVLLGIIIAIIAIIIIVLATTVTPPATIWTLFSWWGGAFAIAGALIVWVLAESFCKTQEEDHLNSDTWCK